MPECSLTEAEYGEFNMHGNLVTPNGMLFSLAWNLLKVMERCHIFIHHEISVLTTSWSGWPLSGETISIYLNPKRSHTKQPTANTDMYGRLTAYYDVRTMFSRALGPCIESHAVLLLFPQACFCSRPFRWPRRQPACARPWRRSTTASVTGDGTWWENDGRFASMSQWMCEDVYSCLVGGRLVVLSIGPAVWTRAEKVNVSVQLPPSNVDAAN